MSRNTAQRQRLENEWVQRLVARIIRGGAIGGAATALACSGAASTPDIPGNQSETRAPPLRDTTADHLIWEPGGPFDPAGYELACEAEKRDLLDGDSLKDQDYVGVHRVSGSEGDLSTEQVQGTPCATATDRPECEATVTERGEGYGYYVVTTKGDTIEKYIGRDRVREWVGIPTSREDALLLVAAENPLLSGGCSPTREGLTQGSLDRYSKQPYVRETDAGWEVMVTRAQDSCYAWNEEVVFFVAEDGAVSERYLHVVDGDFGCAGRRPAGVFPAPTSARHDVGSFLARMAELEALSVPSFQRLATELQGLGAPRGLVAACKDAARDEVRHAGAIGQVARERGGVPRPRLVRRPLPRSATEIARENAVEGCIRETFGAILATRQGREARDPAVRAVFRSIAADETRHAALAWRIAAWIEPRLSAPDRAQIEMDRRRATGQLQTPPALNALASAQLGLPEPAAWTRLATAFAEAVVAPGAGAR